MMDLRSDLDGSVVEVFSRTSLGVWRWLCMMIIVGTAVVPSLAADSTGNGVQQNTFSNVSVVWQLKNLRVTSPGHAMHGKEGTFTQAYVVEADALSSQPGMAQKSNFRLSLDVFSPTEDMAGQHKGQWYVQGRWTVEPEMQEQSLEKNDALSGRVQAALPFDPTIEKSAWNGNVRIPLSRIRLYGEPPKVLPVRGVGKLVLSGGGEGSLSIDLKLWPIL